MLACACALQGFWAFLTPFVAWCIHLGTAFTASVDVLMCLQFAIPLGLIVVPLGLLVAKGKVQRPRYNRPLSHLSHLAFFIRVPPCHFHYSSTRDRWRMSVSSNT